MTMWMSPCAGAASYGRPHEKILPYLRNVGGSIRLSVRRPVVEKFLPALARPPEQSVLFSTLDPSHVMSNFESYFAKLAVCKGAEDRRTAVV